MPQCSHPFVGGPQLTDVCAAGNASLFLTVLNALLVANPKIGNPCGRIQPVNRPAPHYDFIVVGGESLIQLIGSIFLVSKRSHAFYPLAAGAAGPVVASRLSEVGKWSVLLIEAGPEEPAGAEVPSNLLLYLGEQSVRSDDHRSSRKQKR